jgi:hypothetical protein
MKYNPIKIIIDNHEYYCDNVKMKRTYSSILEGYPDKKFNERILKDIKSIWEHVPLCIVQPNIIENIKIKNHEYEIFPSYQYGAWIYTHEIDMSHLYLVWFDDEPGERSIKNIVENGLKQINWKDNAKEFDF